MTSTHVGRRWLVYPVALLVLILGGCDGPDYEDLTGQLPVEQLDLPVAEYRSLAWIDPEQIALVYRMEASGELNADRRIGLFNLRTGALRDIAIPPLADDCLPGPSGVDYLERLPDESIGFIQHCHRNGLSARLFVWDEATNTVRLRQAYNPPFLARRFTFSPDLKELIQEDAEGAGLNDNLVRVLEDGRYEEMLPDFVRARGPSWSPDGDSLAFSGTRAAPAGQGGLLRWRQVESLARRPWDLFLMDTDSGELRVLLAEAGNIYQLNWSPVDAHLLAFAGDFHKTPGIWILDVDTLEVVRVWPENTEYDWSPDGRRMVIIRRNGSERAGAVIIPLSLQPTDN